MHASALPHPPFATDRIFPLERWEPAGTVDMLLPAMHLQKLNTLREDEGSMNHLFRLLLGRYRNRILRAGIPGGRAGHAKATSQLQYTRIRMRYQYPGLNLKRISMRFEEEVWVELRLLSLATRLSMSRLLVLLVVWEYTRRYKFALRRWSPPLYGTVGTPTSSHLTMTYTEESRLYRIKTFFSESTPLIPPRWYRPSHGPKT